MVGLRKTFRGPFQWLAKCHSFDFDAKESPSSGIFPPFSKFQFLLPCPIRQGRPGRGECPGGFPVAFGMQADLGKARGALIPTQFQNGSAGRTVPEVWFSYLRFQQTIAAMQSRSKGAVDLGDDFPAIQGESLHQNRRTGCLWPTNFMAVGKPWNALHETPAQSTTCSSCTWVCLRTRDWLTSFCPQTEKPSLPGMRWLQLPESLGPSENGVMFSALRGSDSMVTA